MLRPPQMADRKTVATVEKSAEDEEIEEGKRGTLSGKNVLSKLEGFPKLLKAARK